MNSDLYHKVNFRYWIYILLLIFCGTCIGLYISTHCFWLIIPAVVSLVCGISGLSFEAHRNIKRIEILLAAIRNDDFSLVFNAQNTSDAIVLKMLNEITNILKTDKLQIAEQDKYYEIIINSIKIGIMVIDEKGYIQFRNSHTLKLLDIFALTHISQLSSLDRLNEHILNLEPNQKGNFLIKTANKELNLSINCSQFEFRGKLLRIITLNDIREEIDINEFDSWIKLTRILTHEIMNGIAPITSLSESLLKVNDIPNDVASGLNVIKSTSAGLMNFVQAYRKFTSIPEPKPSLVYTKVVIEKSINLCANYLYNIQLSLNVYPENLIVYVDESLITQVLVNIIKNATEALQEAENPLLYIEAYCQDEDESIIIKIANNGEQIPSEIIDQIFIPFFTTKGTSGNGIGLSVSRQIMRLSGGELQVKSTPTLTTFTLIFK